MSLSPRQIHAQAAELAAGLPALMLAAERLAQAVAPGAHGLRRSGQGEDFWQYRPAHDSDGARQIDWRRSARSDARFVRERERQNARALGVWVAGDAGMDYAGQGGGESKAARARLLALGAAIMALRAGERAALLGETPRQGMQRAEAMARAMLQPASHAARSSADNRSDPASPDPAQIRPGVSHLLIGDFLGDLSGFETCLQRASALGAGGVLVQVLHPDEEDFPFDGALRFEAPGGASRFETRDAGGLRAAYRARLGARRDQLARLAAGAGWRFVTHRLDVAPARGLEQIYGALTL
ncbi:MAG: DUF58 domain-containing protein [Paracoccus sp. (in: a-proteobacteria)]|nr:DUF58 domain-containing protein [Paracoccus sp. (in: a-proteobacteria)]